MLGLLNIASSANNTSPTIAVVDNRLNKKDFAKIACLLLVCFAAISFGKYGKEHPIQHREYHK